RFGRRNLRFGRYRALGLGFRLSLGFGRIGLRFRRDRLRLDVGGGCLRSLLLDRLVERRLVERSSRIRGTLGLAIGIRLEQGVQFGLGRWRRCSVGQRLILVRSGRWRLRSETESRRESGRETGLPIRLPVRRVRASSVRRARTFSRCLVLGAAPEAPASRRRRLRWSAGVAWLGRGGGPGGRNPPRLGSGICRRRTG